MKKFANRITAFLLALILVLTCLTNTVFASSTGTTVTYTVRHYTEDLSGSTYSLYTTDYKTGTTGASVTVANLKKTITGFTYSYGKVGSSTVTTTTILADGSRVINLYYTRNSYTVTLNKGTGISSVTGAGTYKYGATVSIGATASTGYIWNGWTVNSGGIDTPDTQSDSFLMPAEDVVLTANGMRITYIITYNLDGGALPEGKFNPPAYTVDTATFTLNNPTKEGYTFLGWTGSNGDDPQTTITITKGSTGNKEYTANWEPVGENTATYKVRHYTYTVSGTSYSQYAVETKTGIAGETVVLADLKKTIPGFTYYRGKVGSNVVTYTTILANGSRVIDLYYTRNSYEVTINKETGISSVSGAGTYKYGETVSIDATVSDGYAWDGWTVNSGGIDTPDAQTYSFTMPAEDVTLTANARAVSATYRVYHYIENLNNSYYAIHSSESKTGTAGETLTLANLKKTIPGFTYSHGTAGGSATTTTTILADGSRSIYLYYTRDRYAVTINKGLGISSVTGAGTYKFGATVPISASVSTGYIWEGWTVNAGGIDTPDSQSAAFIMPDNAVTLTANAKAITYSIKFNANGGSGTMHDMVMTYNITKNLTENAFTRTGYTFTGWNTNSSGTGTSYADKQSVINLTATDGDSVILYAQWTPNTNTKYTVRHYTEDLNATTYSLNSTETKNGTTGERLSLANLKKTIPGFTYSHGKLGSVTVSTATILADGTLEIDLYYTRNEYEVAINKGTGIDSVTGAGTYDYGATVSIGATVADGYTWDGWTVNSGGIATPDTQSYSFTMPANAVSLTANATANTYTIAYNLDGGSVATANPTSYTVNTATFTLNNPTKTGYTFAGWTGSNGTTPQTTVTITKGSTGNRSYTANWTTSTVKYTVEHWQEKIGVDGTDYANNYTKITTETLYTNAGALVKPTVNTYEGFTSPAPQEATVEADGNTVVKYYYARNRYVLSIGKGTGISTVSGNGTYDYGQSVTIGATTDSGYSWNGWIVNSGGIATPSTQSASFTMPANAVVLTANGRIDELANDSSTWTEWVPEGDVLVKRTYKVASDGMVLEITPDRSNPAISTEVDSVMRSGYGFSAEQKTGWKNEEGYDEADDAAVTGFQTVSGHFPEFRTQTDIYAVGRNKVRWMEDSDKDGIFELPVNTEDADGENERLHFTPVWFPDMNYIMWTQAYDCWTPAGMISAASQSNPIEIIGSLFDDWYIGRRGN